MMKFYLKFALFVFICFPLLNAFAADNKVSDNHSVSAVHTSVSISGGVKQPGTFDITKPISLIELIAKAGGPTQHANTNDIRITRSDGKVVKFNLEIYSRNPSNQNLPFVSPGDSIFIPDRTIKKTRSWLTAQRNQTLQIMGAVVQPGRYDWSDDLTILDAIVQAGGPLPRADISHIKILPQLQKGVSKKPEIFDMEQFLNLGGDLDKLPVIKPGYTIIVPPGDQVPNNWLMQSTADSIYVFGEVRAPGRYLFSRSMSFLDIVSVVGGPTNNADINDIHILHRNGLQPEISSVNLGLYFRTGDPSLLPNLLPEDAIYFPSLGGGIWNNQDPQQRIRVLGAIAKPGRYTFSDDMNIMDLITEAGGPAANALYDTILVIHPDTKDRRVVRFDMEAYSRTGDPKYLPLLRTGDIIYVPYASEGYWRRLLDKVQDVSNVLVILKIAGVI
jgi:protein involved in polysaccharide export with SLBB domain